MLRALLGLCIVILLGSIFGSSIVRNVYVAVFWFLSLHWLQMLLLIIGVGVLVFIVKLLLLTIFK